MELMLGIDLGTTHLKVAAFDAAGRQHSLEMSRTDTIFQGEGKAIYKPSVIWESAAALLKKTVSRLPSNYKISSIATASMGEAGLFLDHNFEPLTPIMAWFDVRGKEVMAEWYELIDAEKCRKITGLSSHNHICSLFKMLWEIKQNPVVLEKAAKWLCLPDFINFRLTGEFATDYSIASRTMLFDIEKKRWSEEILDLAGLPAGLLPKALPSGTIIGEVTKKAAAETGLPEGIPVCLGGHDHICGSFASNVICQGRVLDSMGTSESLVVVLEGLQQDGLADLAAYDVGCHVLPDLHYALGAIHAGGSSLEWFFRQVAKTKDSYESLVDEAG
ncbi:MAG TPA: hypothetical protein GX528_09950, partial [Firmicutes bacterium]|nr:hypothetical protein [Bacillota bacterium]